MNWPVLLREAGHHKLTCFHQRFFKLLLQNDGEWIPELFA